MADWNLLNKTRVRTGELASDEADGFNGMFLVRPFHRRLRVLATDGDGWRHVSISVSGNPWETPTWEEMCAVKELFWDAEETAMQLHPPRSEYVNNHPGCLHLWSPTGGHAIPRPPGWMVGLKEWNPV